MGPSRRPATEQAGRCRCPFLWCAPWGKRSGGDSGFAAVFLVLIVLNVDINFIWWIVGATALVGAFFAVRP